MILNLEARGLNVSHGHPLHKRGCYVGVDLTMDEDQAKDALYALIRMMRPQAAHMLREEFPDLFAESA